MKQILENEKIGSPGVIENLVGLDVFAQNPVKGVSKVRSAFESYRLCVPPKILPEGFGCQRAFSQVIAGTALPDFSSTSR